MSIANQTGQISQTPISNAGAMEKTIRRLGIVPFFTNAIPGFSIEEMTPGGLWFNDDNLGPWDWKIACIQAGDIAYGKFLWGGKSAFATLEWYAELMNWRRSLPKYAVKDGQQAEVLALIGERGSAGIRDIRERLGVKKSIADGIVTRLQQQTRLVTGDIRRVYRGPDLHYNGWQTATFCTPEALFGGGIDPASRTEGAPGAISSRMADVPGATASRPADVHGVTASRPASFLGASLAATFGAASPFSDTADPLETGHSPAESYERLVAHIGRIAPQATPAQIAKLLQ